MTRTFTAARTQRKRYGARASALRPAFWPARDFTSSGNAGDLVAGVLANRVFNGVPMALRATEMHEDAARDSTKPVAPAILSPVFFSRPNRVFNE